MLAKIEQLRRQAAQAFAGARTPEDLEALRIRFLGRKGLIAALSSGMRDCPPRDRARAGRALNELKSFCLARVQEKTGAQAADRTAVLPDPTLPGIPPRKGSLHPITQTIRELCEICRNLGFEAAWGPEVESAYYNFDALNIPASHPDRDETDTLYLDQDVLLRTQTSTVQIRVMEKVRPPVRIVAPGRVFRNDTDDASHYHMFHQIEGLWVDEGITMAHLKSVLLQMFRALFGQEINIRFWPSFFPFTEPSAEVHMSCTICAGRGCPVCSQTGWLEMGGCGMVDPNVFEAVGYDAERYTGMAFGMGIDRITMLRRRIKDIRLLFENDVRFLEQF